MTGTCLLQMFAEKNLTNQIHQNQPVQKGKKAIGENMIIPIRCFSCGKPLAHLYEEFKQRIEAGEPAKKVMDELGMERYCCRSLFLGHVDLIDTSGQFKKF